MSNRISVVSDRRQNWAILVPLGVAVIAVILVAVQHPGLVLFNVFSVPEFLQEMMPLFFIALLIERTLEVFVTAWRGAEAAQRKTALKEAVRKATSGVTQCRHDVKDHAARTQRIALVAGITLGILVSAAGVRSMEIFVDVNAFANLASAQRTIFQVSDVVLTGALLGGGADGLHRLISVFTDFLDSTRDRREGV